MLKLVLNGLQGRALPARPSWLLKRFTYRWGVTWPTGKSRSWIFASPVKAPGENLGLNKQKYTQLMNISYIYFFKALFFKTSTLKILKLMILKQQYNDNGHTMSQWLLPSTITSWCGMDVLFHVGHTQLPTLHNVRNLFSCSRDWSPCYFHWRALCHHCI